MGLFCSECDLFFHVNCSTPERQHSRDKKEETKAEKIDPNLVKLPRANKSVDLIVQLINKLNSEGKEKTIGARDQQRPSIIHEHQLINPNNLKTDQHSEMSCSSAAAAGKQSEIRQYNGCGNTILEGSSSSHCAKPECNFFIHNCCAELPNELERPCHPRHPILLITHQSPNFCPRFCNVCECASLPIGIRHESHQHTLALRPSLDCSLCDTDFGNFSFVCETCDHEGVIEDHHEEDYCEICGENIDSECSFYHYH